MSRCRIASCAFLFSVFLIAACDAPGRSGNRGQRFQRAQATEPTDPSRGYDVEHYAIDVELYPEEKRIEGVCKIRLYPAGSALEKVQLDLVGLDVRGVRDQTGADLRYRHADELLTVELRDPLAAGDFIELSVFYGGVPVTGLWFSGERADGSGPTQVFSHGQARNNRGWFPCFDHPSDRATSEVRVTMPDGWISVAPGQRIDRLEGSGKVTEHWSMKTPHPSYLVSLVAGEFVLRETTWDGIPLQFMAEQRYAPWLEASFAETDEILTFLSDYTGVRYPYPKYSQAVVANFPWGGMENISATTLTPLTLDDERGNRDNQSHGLVAHEAAHQWFGDLITCNDWSDIWLNEGFATYMTLLYFEQTRGVDEFRARMRDAQNEYIEADRGADRRPTVTSVYKDPEDLMSEHVYQGAAARLHMLRFVLGDDAFREGVRTYTAEFAQRNVTTEDFQRTMEKVSGRELGWFFDQWFRRPGYPEFSVGWSWSDKRKELTIDVRQVHGTAGGTPAVFRTPVAIEIRDERGTIEHRIEVTERRQSFEFRADRRPFYVRFDKGSWIPKALTVRKKQAEWVAQAGSDGDVNGRRDAMRALGELAARSRISNPATHETYVATIATRLRDDSSPWVRADAAVALGEAGGLEARERLVVATRTDPEARVRTASLTALRKWGANLELAGFARAMWDDGFSWGTMGAAAGLVCTSDPENAYTWITQKLFTDSPHDQLVGTLLGHLGGLPDRAVPEQLTRWARDEAVHPQARAEALRQLAKQSRARVENARTVAGFLEAGNFRLRRAAVESLASFKDRSSREALRAYYPRASTAEERRVIEAALSGTRP